MKHQKWVRRKHPKNTWTHGLVRDGDGVLKVCEWYNGGYVIVGTHQRRISAEERGMILRSLFIGLGEFFGLSVDELDKLVLPAQEAPNE